MPPDYRPTREEVREAFVIMNDLRAQFADAEREYQRIRDARYPPKVANMGDLSDLAATIGPVARSIND